MNDHLDETSSSEEVQEMIASRDVSSVLKSELVLIRSEDSEVAVFAFEGKDDKIVYFHWVKQISPDLEYEPFVCKNKKKVLQLRRILDRDLGDLRRGVFFFVDRDYDDLCGEEDSDNLFMTDDYSFENHLVNEKVVKEFLKNELHCHGNIVSRKYVLELFTKQYLSFLQITKELNFRIYIAKKCGIERVEELPKGIGRIAKVNLTTVEGIEPDAKNLVLLEREPTQTEIDEHQPNFMQLEPSSRYRGKYAWMFLCAWLDKLAIDRNEKDTLLFKGFDQENFVARRNFNLDNALVKAGPPPKFKDFIGRITT